MIRRINCVALQNVYKYGNYIINCQIKYGKHMVNCHAKYKLQMLSFHAYSILIFNYITLIFHNFNRYLDLGLKSLI